MSGMFLPTGQSHHDGDTDGSMLHNVSDGKMDMGRGSHLNFGFGDLHAYSNVLVTK